MIALQNGFLDGVKDGIENHGLDPDSFRPLVEVVGPDGTAVWYKQDEVLNLHKGPIKPFIRDLCMARWDDCHINLKVFYLLKQLYEQDDRYTKEDLMNFSNFDEYLPLF